MTDLPRAHALPPADPPRPRTGGDGRRWDRLAACACIAFALVVLRTFADFGITWDEDTQITYGELVLRWYASGFADQSALHYRNLFYYGGLFEVLGELAYRVSPLGLYYTRHLLGGLLGVAGIVYAWRLARELQGPAAGLLGALAFALSPVLFGHLFNNPKDGPFAVAYLAAVYYLVRAARRYPRVPPWLLARLGIATGVALGIRVGAVLLVLYWGGSLLLWGAAEWRRRGRPALRDAGMLALRLLPPALLAYGIMLAAWPWGQVDPLRNPLDAVRASAKFPFRVPVLFQGNTYLATELPWYYMPKLLLLTIPEFVLLGLAIALVRAVLAGRSGADLSRGASDVGVEGRRRVGTADASDAESAHGAAGWHGYVLVATAMLFPLAYACSTHATLYDGQRHFLFAMPLAGVLAATAYAWLAAEHRRAGLILGALAALSVAYTAADMVRLHPYQSVYFNPLLAGGARGAEGRYDLDYWGASYREGAEWLARRFPAGSTARPLKVASCGAAASVTQFLPRRFEYVGTLMIPPLAAKPDVLLATPRFGCDRWLGGRVVHTIRREGAALVYVIEPAPSPPAPATAPPTAR